MAKSFPSLNKTFALLLAMLMALSCGGAAIAQIVGPADKLWQIVLPKVALLPGEDGPDLLEKVRFLSDYQRPLTYSGIGEEIAGLRKVDYNRIVLGRERAPVLAMVRVENSGSRPGKWIFSTDRYSLKSIKIFEISGKYLTETYSDISVEERLLNWQRFVSYGSEIYLLPGEEKVLGVLFEAESSNYMELSVQTEENLRALDGKRTVVISIVVGAIFSLIFFNGVMFAITGKSYFVFLTISELLFLYEAIYMAGYATIYIFYDDILLGRLTSELTKVAFVVFSVEFIIRFLGIKNTHQTLIRLLRGLQLAAAAGFVLLLFTPFFGDGLRQIATNYAWFMAGLNAIVLPTTVAYTRNTSYASNLLLVVGLGILSSFIIYSVLSALLLVPILPEQWRLYGPIGLLETSFITLAVGLDLKRIQRKSVATQKQLTQTLKSELQAVERSKILAEEKALAYANLNDQSSLIHAAGHDSKQVIVALNTATHYLEGADKDIPPAIVHMLKSASQHLSGVVSTTIASAQNIGNTAQVLALSHKNIDAVFQSLLMIFKPVAAQKGVRLQAFNYNNRPFVSDFALLYRVLSNFVSNAIKFSDNNGVALLARYGRSGIRIEIRDKGIGMSEKDLEMLLEESRHSYHPDDAVEGTGRGVKTSLEIVRRIGGTVQIASQEGQGTLVKLFFPYNYSDKTLASKRYLVPSKQKHYFETVIAKSSVAAKVTERAGLKVVAAIVNLDVNLDQDNAAIVEGLRKKAGGVPIIGVTNDVSMRMREWASEWVDGLLYMPLSRELLLSMPLLRASDDAGVKLERD